MNYISVKSLSQDIPCVQNFLQGEDLSFEGLINGSLPLFSSTALNAKDIKVLMDQSAYKGCIVKDEFGFERNTVCC